VIIRFGSEFLDCRWDDDDLVVSDLHNRERIRVRFDVRHLPTRPERLAALIELVDSRAVCGGKPEPINLDGSPAR